MKELLNRIFADDPLTVMAQQFPSDGVHLAIAMPPDYKTVRDYDGYVVCARLWLQAVYRVLKPGRRLVWIVQNFGGEVYREGMRPFAHDSMWLATNVGFVLREEIIWHDTADQARFPSGSYPYGPSVCLRHTGLYHLLVLQKPATQEGYERYQELGSDLKPYWIMDSKFYAERMSNTVWDIHRRHDDDTLPEALVEPLIRMWSRPGEAVLDPFARDGKTCLTAMTWKRYYIGIESDASRAQLAERNIHERAIQLWSEGH